MSHRARHQLPTRRLATIGVAAAATAGLIASAGLVWQSSYSAFLSKTTTPASNWTAGTVALDNNASGAALWTVTGLKPGLSDSKCVTVTSNGSLPSTVKLYTTNGTLATTNGLTSAIDLKIEQGTLSGGSNCSNNFTRDSGGILFANNNVLTFGTSNNNYANSVGNWTTAGGTGETKVYRFSWTFDPQYSQSAVDTYQGGTASIGFTWEARNT